MKEGRRLDGGGNGCLKAADTPESEGKQTTGKLREVRIGRKCPKPEFWVFCYNVTLSKVLPSLSLSFLTCKLAPRLAEL